MSVRRFRCPKSECPRRIFVERLGGFVARHARTTTRLAQTHRAIGAAVGGEAGARLAAATAMPTSPDTLLRRVKQAKARSSDAPRFVGIDDWAWCKGLRYGTIVVDLETNDVIDLLPDRDAATVKTALTQHSCYQPQSSVLDFAEEPKGEEKPAKTIVRAGNRPRFHGDFVSPNRKAKSSTGIEDDASTV